MPSGNRETERKGNPPVNTGPSPNSDEHANNTVEEVNEPSRGSSSNTITLRMTGQRRRVPRSGPISMKRPIRRLNRLKRQKTCL
ncbi:hypothetical protein T05_5678 [Trichinella murrelli]|uniref:Uncharacterized protein n=1 Tax=Trichinella murrelli TaxID=144512 RepID=A0A0V0TEA4_9BILA|nr:hypothetical protein T05_5678 [Trichinella murrelli]